MQILLKNSFWRKKEPDPSKLENMNYTKVDKYLNMS